MVYIFPETLKKGERAALAVQFDSPLRGSAWSGVHGSRKNFGDGSRSRHLASGRTGRDAYGHTDSIGNVGCSLQAGILVIKESPQLPELSRPAAEEIRKTEFPVDAGG